MIDKETGMPVLPEGYFWRVTRGRGSQYVYLQMRKRRWLGSKAVDESIIRKHEVTAELVVTRARRILLDFNPDSDYKQFVGDYPPNKLALGTGEGS